MQKAGSNELSPKLRNQPSPRVSPSSQIAPNTSSEQTPSPRLSNNTDDDLDGLVEGFGRFSFNSPNSRGANANTPGPPSNSRPSKSNQKAPQNAQKKNKSSAQANEPPKQSKFGRKYKKPTRLTYS